MKTRAEFALPLALLRQAVATSQLLPGVYRRYRPLLADGLIFFLEHLSPARLRQVLAEQRSLPSSTPVGLRVVTLLHHAPALHKLGQVVARDRRLHPGFRKRLQRLESLEPRTPPAEVRALLNQQVQGWKQADLQPAQRALAEGSVAVILPFEWQPQAAGNRSVRGVFKLLKPGIAHRLEEDLQILGRLGDFLDEDCARYHLPAVSYRETFDTIRELLLHEVRLEEEQRHLAEAARLYAHAPAVLIPALLPFCSPQVTAMERIEGVKLADSRLLLDARQRLARTAVESLIGQPFFARAPSALFHADPHAGNLLVTPAGRLAILDWSLTGHLRQADRVQLVQLLAGACTLDLQRMKDALRALACTCGSTTALERTLQGSLCQLRQGVAPGMSWLTQLLDRVVLEGGVRFGGDLLLFRKSLLTLEGVLADLLRKPESTQQALLDSVFLGQFLESWAAEWPERWHTPLGARGRQTHLSMADVLRVVWSTPLVATRWWQAASQDWFAALKRN